jgi:hypothetical protein
VFEAVCGTEGPLLLLRLAGGEHAYGVDRVTADEPVLGSMFFVDPALPRASLPPTLDLAIHAWAPAVRRRSKSRGLALTARHGDASLACNDGGHGALVIDPDRHAPPRPILDAWCPLRSTDVGLLAVEADPEERHGTLVLIREATCSPPG